MKVKRKTEEVKDVQKSIAYVNKNESSLELKMDKSLSSWSSNKNENLKESIDIFDGKY